MVDQDNLPHLMVKDPNIIIQVPWKKELIDILVSGKYLVLPNRYLKKLVMICQRSVWDDRSDEK